eukprot:jgi/Astpho2/7430/Aster-02013
MQGSAAAQQVATGLTCRQSCLKRKRGPLSCRAAASNGARQTTIHKLIEEHGNLIVPGIYDALSARICSQQGAKAAFLSGYAVSATLLGEPDVGLLTPPEMSRKAGQVCMSVPTPVIVDADTGGGNVLNVQRTVRQFIAAGAKGCILEDQKWPKKSGSMRGKEVIGLEEHVAKIRAAKEVIGDSDFFLVARTDVRATSAKHGLDEAITRANVYIDAGADASYVEAPRNVHELKEVGQKTKGIRVCSMLEGGLTPVHTFDSCRDMGFNLVLRPVTGVYAAARALLTVYGQLLDKGELDEDQFKLLASFDEFNSLVRLEERLALEERYGRGDGMEKLTVRVKAQSLPYYGD